MTMGLAEGGAVQVDVIPTRKAGTEDDGTLLRVYVQKRCDNAFTVLVQRYVDVVYNSALRQVRDPGMAEDVVQAVFVLLAWKAPRLRKRTMIGGWLLRTTRFAARDALKLQARRRRHERAAAALRKEEPPMNMDTQAEVSPLDEAMARLREADRDVIVMRYLQEQSPAQVAAGLRISEQAARQRCSRAVGRLRRELRSAGNHGCAMGAVLLGVRRSAVVTPANVVHVAEAAKLGMKGAVKGAGHAIAHAVAKSMVFTKSVALACTAAVAVGTAGAAYTVRARSPRPIAPKAVAHPMAELTGTTTPLMQAIQRRDSAEAKRLIDAGADLNAVSRDGNNTTALMYVAMQMPRDSGLPLVKKLVERGVDVNVRHGQWGYSVLSPAVRLHSVETVRYLLAHRADPNLASKTGQTPLQVAREEHDAEITSALLAAGAR